jgi:hypothetical protein
MLAIVLGMFANSNIASPNSCEVMTPDEFRSHQPPRLVGEKAKVFSYPFYSAEVVTGGKQDRADTPIYVEPGLAVQAFGGWLLGSNRGEWGGELAFKSPDGPVIILAEDNIVEIIRMPSTFVAVAGLAHLSMSEGAIYEISANDRGVPRAERRHVLPGAPGSIRLLRSGDLLITARVRSGNSIRAELLRLDRNSSIAPFKCE